MSGGKKKKKTMSGLSFTSGKRGTKLKANPASTNTTGYGRLIFCAMTTSAATKPNNRTIVSACCIVDQKSCYAAADWYLAAWARARARFACSSGRCFSDQRQSARNGSIKVRPSLESEYSTFGGTTG